MRGPPLKEGRGSGRRSAAVAALVATLAIGAAPARADEVPPGSCSSPGQTCMTAGPRHDKRGLCVAATCTKTLPAPDGGTRSITYDCHECLASAAKSSGCAVASERGDAGSLAITALLIAGMMLVARRRRRRYAKSAMAAYQRVGGRWIAGQRISCDVTATRFELRLRG